MGLSTIRGGVRMKTKLEPLVHLNTNPCKMCMPMGAVTAFYGIQKCITILHGSQGCSTYIRRHMATHYNEPVDVASSSLTEHGTVYGGEENLLKGLKNVIELYAPEVIGVATTCLAETIGEDIKRIVEKFYTLYPEYRSITILPVHSSGYSGTQFNGYFNTLTQIVGQIKMSTKKHEKINIVTGMISPADTRELKKILEVFEIEAIFLTDLSTNLDGGFANTYNRLPLGGTSIEAIKEMAGSKMTLEFCIVPLALSPGKYLEEHYGVPCKVLGLPMGLRDTDLLYKTLSEFSGKPIPESLKGVRGRYLDAMVDSHKYNSGGRAVIYGDPDFVVGATRLCSENGIMPVVVATGSVCPELKGLLGKEIQDIAQRYFIEDFKVVDDVDFKTIETLAIEYKANLLVGNSDGRRIEEKYHIPLIRRGFPIHDRVGGQRLRTLGYEGALTFLDELSNALLSNKETSFRKKLYNTYYKEESPSSNEENKKKIEKEISLYNSELEMKSMLTRETILEKTKTHPCFNCGAHDHARIHLPIAPRCNIQCNYCVRKFDCPNESRPGVTTTILTPQEAFERYKYVKEKLPNLSVVGIAGPGDALANFEETKTTLELIRAYDPDITFCLSTNGLMLPLYAQELVDLGVSHVTVTVNAVDPKIGAKIYKYVDYMGMHFIGETAAAILLTNQLNGIKLLTSKGIICKINIVTLKGINDEHIPKVVEKMKELDCYITNIMQLIPVKGSAFEDLPMASQVEINKIRQSCGETMKQMYHCKQCRADAIGILGEDLSIELNKCLGKCGPKKEEMNDKQYRFAIASKSGMIVDEHFGHVEEFHIYEYQGEEVKYIEKRKINKYCMGKEACDEKEDKITRIIRSVEDCQGVITLRIGEAPKSKLKEKGIKVFSTYDRISDAIKKAVEEM